jgi:putative transposase
MARSSKRSTRASPSNFSIVTFPACYDNAPMESFFHTLKTELVHHQHYATREEARREIFAYIEGFYNRTRRHSAIGYLSPIEMELKAT